MTAEEPIFTFVTRRVRDEQVFTGVPFTATIVFQHVLSPARAHALTCVAPACARMEVRACKRSLPAALHQFQHRPGRQIQSPMSPWRTGFYNKTY